MKKEELPNDSSERKETFKEIRRETLMRSNIIVESGECWIVDTVMQSEVRIKPGAKFTAETAMRCKFIIEGDGELEITGADMQNEVIRD